MPKKYDPNALWVSISEYGEGNLFHVYPQLLAELLMEEDAARVDGDTSEAEKLVLPSDKEWRVQQYFLLVALQKRPTSSEGNEAPKVAERVLNGSLEEWAPWALELPVKNPNAPAPVHLKTTPGPEWDIAQVLKAARLLFKPPYPVEFVDEQEMRHVYSVIYDVFRYKTILDQAIDQIEFFENYPQYFKYRNTTWLFVMELARRKWSARPRGETDRAEKLLRLAGFPFFDIEKAVWEQRVHFAAAVARIRIKNKAFTLADLLPPHLREERLSACVHKETVTGWVNTFKAKKVASLVKRLHELGYSYSNSRQLCAGEYRFDRVCPRFITLRPPNDVSLCQLDLVRDGIIVLQEREFCEGASTLCRALRANALQGVVAQTHASSPRSSAYLASQLRELASVIKAKGPQAPTTPELGKLVVFGAGDKVSSYVCALRELGIEASEAPQPGASVYVLSEAVYCDTPNVANALDGVVAALATPPNSYSAVSDPIDLVCGRGGDLTMLEILTETDIDASGKARVHSILEEQKKTLKTLLSKPQIQLILYETHSSLEAENQAQVTRAVAEANRLARERHALLKKKNRDPREPSPTSKGLTEIPSESTMTTVSQSELHVVEMAVEHSKNPSRPSSRNENVLKKRCATAPAPVAEPRKDCRPIPEDNIVPTTPHDPDIDCTDIFVPNCDLFEVGTLPNLGNGLDINYILDRDGCYLGLIQRKEITCLDAKYMIRVAEERGLFAATEPAPALRRKRDAPAATTPRRRRRRHCFEIERVAAPTYSSIVRSCRRASAPSAYPPGVNVCAGAEDPVITACEKHQRRQAAAAANTCTCHSHHRARGARGRRASAELARPEAAGAGACRIPFPVVVHDLQLRTFINHKIFAS